MEPKHDSEERAQLLREVITIMEEVKDMTPEDADERWEQFGRKLKDWGERANKHLDASS